MYMCVLCACVYERVCVCVSVCYHIHFYVTTTIGISFTQYATDFNKCDFLMEKSIIQKLWHIYLL